MSNVKSEEKDATNPETIANIYSITSPPIVYEDCSHLNYGLSDLKDIQIEKCKLCDKDYCNSPPSLLPNSKELNSLDKQLLYCILLISVLLTVAIVIFFFRWYKSRQKKILKNENRK